MSLLWNASDSIRSELHSGCRLIPVDPSERAALDLAPGTKHVLIAWRKKEGGASPMTRLRSKLSSSSSPSFQFPPPIGQS